MPRQQGLLRRNGRYYLNLKVPLDLREAFGKEHVRQTLGTSDYREAVRKVGFERARWMAHFENERRNLASVNSSSQPDKRALRKLVSIGQGEAFEFACRFLTQKEARFRSWMEAKGNELGSSDRSEVAFTLSEDVQAITEADSPYRHQSNELRDFLTREGIECASSSPAFQTLAPLFRAAKVEHLSRSMDALLGQPVVERDQVFKGTHALSPAKERKKKITLDELITIKERTNEELRRSTKTVDAFKLPARLLRETLGGGTPLSSITREDMERVFAIMREIPLNAEQRYRGLTIAEAIEAAKRAGDNRKPVQNTLWAHYVHIAALFNFAVEDGIITENPAASRKFRQLFQKGRTKLREQFTIDELNQLFRAPLYVGCVNDREGYSTRGNFRERRGRFWVPLLALFHGMRCNEVCQLYTEDVKTRDGILLISVREEREDGSACDKKLKTKQSTREVPVHPELLAMGFSDFVAKREADTSSPRLFPELTSGHNGYFSDAFSKWFVRFVRGVLGEDCKATMHSFRHQFRDATRVARLPTETVARLAGWEDGGHSLSRQISRYGGGKAYFRALADDLAKVRFEGLDLSHLHTRRVKPTKRVRDR